MLSRKYDDQMIYIFEEKINMLKETFFSFSSNANLSNLQSFIYSASSKCFITITEKEVTTILKRFRFDKASNSNEIINRLLAACTDILTKFLT